MDPGILGIDAAILSATVAGTASGLELAGINPSPVGVGRASAGNQPYSAIIGLVGRHSGALTMSFSERGLLHVASCMMGQVLEEIDEMALDCTLEVVNIVGGQIKASLVDSDFDIDHISLPSLFMGSQSVYYSRGIEACSVTFEITNMPMQYFEDRYFTSQVSLMRRSGN